MDSLTVYTELRNMILSGAMQPGERLVSQQIADQLGASRTPVREALARLETTGLVTRLDRWGYAVRSLTLHDAEHLFESRIVVEVANAGLAARRVSPTQLDAMQATRERANALLEAGRIAEFQRASRRFHEYIAESTDNGLMLQMFYQINDLVTLFGITLLRASPTRAAEIAQENALLYDAIAKRDPALAEATMRDHITHAHGHFRRSIDNARINLAFR
ncbi:GntR family transcriptional regulator [Imbroritus primus]|uniref:GntR family transcriptional regulator n=1 Tax=Imbroritus primus TaxID=3058603 RepID=A0ACD3SSL8_9BURK|nr:GntR family transcriptional regulator [Burkholderiaceae bacterium PBA]